MADEPTAAQDDIEQDGPVLDLENAGGDEPAISRPSIAASLRERGFELSDDATDDDVLSRMEELETAAEERDRLKQENAQLQAWYAQQQHKPEPAKEPEQKQPESTTPERPEAPEWNSSWESYLDTDERGNIVIRDQYRGAVDPSLPEKYIKRKQWERERLQKVLENADSLFDESRFESKLSEVEERAYKRALEEVEKKQSERERETALQAFQRENEEWLFSGPDFSPVGRVFNDRLSAHLQRGMSPEEALRYAKFDTQEQTGQTPWQSEQAEEKPEKPTPAQKRINLRRKRTNGDQQVTQPPVSRKVGANESVDTARSIKQLGNRWKSALEQEVGTTE